MELIDRTNCSLSFIPHHADNLHTYCISIKINAELGRLGWPAQEEALPCLASATLNEIYMYILTSRWVGSNGQFDFALLMPVVWMHSLPDLPAQLNSVMYSTVAIWIWGDMLL